MMTTKYSRALLTALVTSASILPLIPFAVRAETIDDVPTVIVTSQPNADDPAAVKDVRRKLSRTPGAVSVVAAEAYSNSYAVGLFDTLKNVSGVFAQKKFGEDGRFSIRGSGIGNSAHNRGSWLAIDGVPINQADGSGDFQEMDPLSVRYIEVYKGGNALRFGGSQLGGAVNYVTPTGDNAGFHQLLRLEGGTFGTLRAHAAFADSFDEGRYDLYASATTTHAEGWRQNSKQSANRFAFNLGRHFGEDRTVRLILQGNDVNQRIAGGLTLNQALTTPQMTTALNYPDLAYGRNMESIRGTIQANWRVNENWIVDAGIYAAWKNLIHPISIYIDYNYQNYGAFVRFDGRGQIGGHRADVFFGANLRQGNTDANIFANTNGAPGMRMGKSQQNATSLDAFAEGRVFVADTVALIAGGSYGWTRRDYINYLNMANNADKSFDWFAPRIGILWENEAGQQVFANLTKSVEAPTYGALVQAPIAQFTTVRPQEATTIEIGTRGRSANLTWDIAIYRASIDGEMLNFIVTPDIPAATFNAEKTVHQGIETALDWSLGEIAGWQAVLRQTYTWSDFHFDGDKVYGNSRLPVIPEHYYRGELALSAKGWRIAPSVEWTPSDVWVDYTNTTQSPGFAVWNLSVSKKINDNLEAFGEVRNLGDTRYVSSVNAITNFASVSASAQKVFTPGEGRSVFFGIKLKR